MSEVIDPELTEQARAGKVRQPPAPGALSAGPALTEMVEQLSRTRQALEQLTREARAEARTRYVSGVATIDLDANGDGAVLLLEVPQGATGHLCWATFDIAGATPAAPVTNADLWMGIFAGQGGTLTGAQAARVGSLLACEPNDVAAAAQLPFRFSYGDRWTAPTLVGPLGFVAVVDGATAELQVAVRYGVLLEQPEP